MQHHRSNAALSTSGEIIGTKSGAFAANIAELLGLLGQPQPGG
jgi:hypothetical protein